MRMDGSITTGIAMLLFSLGFLVGSRHFSSAFKNLPTKNDSSRLGKLLYIYFFVVGVQTGLLGLVTQVFYENPLIIKNTIIVSNILLGIHALIGVYVVYDVSYPRDSKAPQLFLVLLSCFLSVALCFLIPFQPIFTLNKNLSMNLPLPIALLIFYMIFISAVSMILVFGKIYVFSKTIATRYFSLGIAILLTLALFSAFLRVVVYGPHEIPKGIDLLFSIIGISLALAFLSPSLLQRIVIKKSSSR